ncbi:MAG: carbon storage regulator [Spirochaetaceae bacterium]|nr:carbon storage regulator [Spirochaetaceae bacterium]
MLVLARKINESIMIGDDIEIVVVDIKGDQVKLGIRAPKNVAIHRTEIYTEIQEQNKEAAQSVTPDKLRDLQKLLGKEKKTEEKPESKDS